MSPPSLLEIAACASAILAADESGLLSALLGSEDDAVTYADRLRLEPRATALVLDVLASWGLVVSRGSRYTASDALRLEMSGPLARVRTTATIFARGAELLRTGATMIPAIEQTAARERTYAEIVPLLGDGFATAANELARAIDRMRAAPPDLRILEVGAGSAVWGLAQIAEHPGARLTAVDLPAVAARARERAQRLGLDDRIDLLLGDYQEVEVPQGAFDRLVFANVLHLEPADVAERLVARFAPALRPGGQVVIVDALPGPDPGEARAADAYAYFLALRVPRSRVHPEADLRAWLAAAGHSRAERIALSGPAKALAALVTA